LSLIGNSGVEVYSDARVFTLYAAYNALGYDRGAVARADPIPRPALGAIRAQARTDLPMSAGLQQRFQAFFDAHPLPRETYLSYVLALGPAPSFAAAAGHSPLAGFEKLLAAYEVEAHVSQEYVKLTEPVRGLLKQSLSQLDPLCHEEDKFLPQGTLASSIALNVLDDVASVVLGGPGSDLIAMAGASEESGEASLSSAARAYAAIRALPLVSAGAVPPGVNDLVSRVRKRGLPAGNLSPAAYVAQSYGAAVAAQVLPKQRQAILEAASAQGLWLAQDLERLLADERGKAAPVTVLGPRLAGLDFRKIAPLSPNP
jgi:hypothetical protein